LAIEKIRVWILIWWSGTQSTCIINHSSSIQGIKWSQSMR